MDGLFLWLNMQFLSIYLLRTYIMCSSRKNTYPAPHRRSLEFPWGRWVLKAKFLEAMCVKRKKEKKEFPGGRGVGMLWSKSYIDGKHVSTKHSTRNDRYQEIQPSHPKAWLSDKALTFRGNLDKWHSNEKLHEGNEMTMTNNASAIQYPDLTIHGITISLI